MAELEVVRGDVAPCRPAPPLALEIPVVEPDVALSALADGSVEVGPAVEDIVWDRPVVHLEAVVPVLALRGGEADDIVAVVPEDRPAVGFLVGPRREAGVAEL